MWIDDDIRYTHPIVYLHQHASAHRMNFKRCAWKSDMLDSLCMHCAHGAIYSYTKYDGKIIFPSTLNAVSHSHFITSNLFSCCLKNHLRFFRWWQWALYTCDAYNTPFGGAASKRNRCHSHKFQSRCFFFSLFFSFLYLYFHGMLEGRTYVYIDLCNKMLN